MSRKITIDALFRGKLFLDMSYSNILKAVRNFYDQ